MDSLVRAELRRLLEVADAAEKMLQRAQAAGDPGSLEELAHSEALADWYACSAGLADLFRLLLRHALKHQADAVRAALVEILRPELSPLYEDVARLERDVRPTG